MSPDHPRLPKFPSQIVQNSPAAGYRRQGIPTNVQDMSQTAKQQHSGYPQPQTSGSYYPPSSVPVQAPEYDRRDRGREIEPTSALRQRFAGGQLSASVTEQPLQTPPQNARRRDGGHETEPTSSGALRQPFGRSPVAAQPLQVQIPPQNARLRDGGRETEPTRQPFGQSSVTAQPLQIPPQNARRRDGGRETEPTSALRQPFGQSPVTAQPLQTPQQNARRRDGGRETEPTTALRQPFGQSSATTQPLQTPSQNVTRRDGGRETEPASALMQAFEQLSVTTRKVNVVLFGEQGAGKSAVVNLIASKTIAPVPSGVRGFPLQSTRYDNRVDGVDVSIFETAGLDELEIRTNDYLVVLEKAHDLVHKLSSAGGVHLLLFCVRGDRLTATTQVNYRLFSEVIFQANVPLALVVTGLEGERELGDWWARNKAFIDRYGIKNEGHACITTIPGRSPVQDYKYTESHRKIRELLKSCCLTTSPSLPNPMDWFFCLWNGMQQFVDKYRRPSPENIMNTLTMRLNLDAQTARAFLENMDRGDAYQSGRGGEGASGHRDVPALAVRVNNREGEGDPRSATSPRSRESDAGRRGLEPHRVGSMEMAQPRNALDPGMRGNEPPRRRQTAEMAITPSSSRYSNAAEEDGVGGQWDDSARRREIGKVKVEPRRGNALMETYTRTEMGVSSRTLNSRVSMEDIRSNFPHDLTGYVTRSSEHAFASGSFGDIYRGKFVVNGELIKVAIKVYKMYLQRDQHLDDRLKRVRKEITVWLNLQHRNVLPLYGTIRDMHPHIPAMVCPWIENGALSGYLNENKALSVTQRLVLLDDVAHGLQYLHSQRVIHGDLSGSNVLVQADGSACIADFGLSTLLTTMGGPSMSASRRTEGTVRWMAPELLNPNNNIQQPGPTMRSDVYSFGGIMLQILTGNIPYHYLSRDVQVIAAILNGAKPDRPAHRAVTDGRWGFITKCWSDGRRPSSDEIADFTQREFEQSRAGRN